MKEEPLIWGLPTLAGMRADLSSGLGSVLHSSCHSVGAGTVLLGVTKSKLWLGPYQTCTSMARDHTLPSATLLTTSS